MPDLRAYFRSVTSFRCGVRFCAGLVTTFAATSERCTHRFPKKPHGARLLRKAGIAWGHLIGPRYAITQEIGLRAWENGIEALLAPSAAHPAERNLAVFLDNQRPLWEVALTDVRLRND